MINMFMGGNNRRPRPTQKPVTSTTQTIDKSDDLKLAEAEAAQPKDFVDVVLEVIRPVFISILGKVSINLSLQLDLILS